jgi:hypothetical protein
MKKFLKVNDFPQGKEYVPGVRVAGKYLKSLGFVKDAPVTMTAQNNVIVLTSDNAIDPKMIDLFIYLISPNTAKP